ncbi:DUF3054 domain-containing protein [Zhihengliuella sp.]|uniref:DUF3054 domain-containing protein n=1 Tax=Zhihengliuella sp. TaxID=1954483 RepID=UPI002811281B|nr:DUF3054 domain-containing protein [Zhihengliuella sp.]
MRSAWLLLVDLALVVGFAALGRQQHDLPLTPLGLLSTAAPFLIALLAMSALSRFPRTHSRLWPQGVLVWAGTVSFGISLRLLFGDTAAVAFIVVAAITLGVLLLGRRALSGFALRRGSAEPTSVRRRALPRTDA